MWIRVKCPEYPSLFYFLLYFLLFCLFLLFFHSHFHFFLFTYPPPPLSPTSHILIQFQAHPRRPRTSSPAPSPVTSGRVRGHRAAVEPPSRRRGAPPTGASPSAMEAARPELVAPPLCQCPPASSPPRPPASSGRLSTAPVGHGGASAPAGLLSTAFAGLL
jgi:hypothetical protein